MENCLPKSQVKLVRADSGMFWKIDAETFGSLPLIQGFIITMGKPFNILQPGRDLPIIGLCVFMKIKPVMSGSPPGVEQAEITSGPPAFLGILEANDGSIWFGSLGGIHRYDGKTITDFKKESQK
jgi:hypothetical protein